MKTPAKFSTVMAALIAEYTGPLNDESLTRYRDTAQDTLAAFLAWLKSRDESNLIVRSE